MVEKLNLDTVKTFKTNERLYTEFKTLLTKQNLDVGHKLTELVLGYVRHKNPKFEL